jgi:AraC-like DNA-binding protein
MDSLRGINKKPEDHRLKKAFELIEADPSLSVAELAQSINLSPSRLEHLVQAQTHIRLRAFIRHRRLKLAISLLESTFLSVKEISARVGYSSAASFARMFRKQMGKTPTTWRQQKMHTNSRF